jgi:hypothetical protein
VIISNHTPTRIITNIKRTITKYENKDDSPDFLYDILFQIRSTRAALPNIVSRMILRIISSAARSIDNFFMFLFDVVVNAIPSPE